MTSTIVLALGLTRSILIVSNVIPISVVRGMQLGLGLSLLRRGLGLITATGGWLPPSSGVAHGGVSFDCYLTGAIGFASVLLMLQHERLPAALLLFSAGHALAIATAATAAAADAGGGLALPTAPARWPGLAVHPRLLGARQPRRRRHPRSSPPRCRSSRSRRSTRWSRCARSTCSARSVPSQTSVATSVGLMNCVGCLFGAMPCCHGAGELAAQHRFGARRGASMLFLGFTKLLLSIFLSQLISSLLNHFPASVLGVLLGFSGLELAKGGRHLQTPRADGRIPHRRRHARAQHGAGCAIGLWLPSRRRRAARVDARPPAAPRRRRPPRRVGAAAAAEPAAGAEAEAERRRPRRPR